MYRKHLFFLLAVATMILPAYAAPSEDREKATDFAVEAGMQAEVFPELIAVVEGKAGATAANGILNAGYWAGYWTWDRVRSVWIWTWVWINTTPGWQVS